MQLQTLKPTWPRLNHSFWEWLKETQFIVKRKKHFILFCCSEIFTALQGNFEARNDYHHLHMNKFQNPASLSWSEIGQLHLPLADRAVLHMKERNIIAPYWIWNMWFFTCLNSWTRWNHNKSTDNLSNSFNLNLQLHGSRHKKFGFGDSKKSLV